jgi:acetylornithine deacetylase/succinyl-diaminopimelate desuccinylase-like protein
VRDEIAVSPTRYNPVEILQRLIRFDTSSPPGNEREYASFIDQLLTQAGIETRLLARSDSRPSLIVQLPRSFGLPVEAMALGEWHDR